MESTIVYTLKPEEINELAMVLNTFTIHNVGITDKGKIIIEYGSRDFGTVVKIINQ